MVRSKKYKSECQPTAPLLPFRPGGFGKPLWQLVDQDIPPPVRAERGEFPQSAEPTSAPEQSRCLMAPTSGRRFRRVGEAVGWNTSACSRQRFLKIADQVGGILDSDR